MTSEKDLDMNNVNESFSYSGNKIKQRFAELIERKLIRIQKNKNGFEKKIMEVELMINYFLK